tara:strand:+ start:723 stop:941 length:219 start_codon:yes stop_codon:yes gene_type:complete
MAQLHNAVRNYEFITKAIYFIVKRIYFNRPKNMDRKQVYLKTAFQIISQYFLSSNNNIPVGLGGKNLGKTEQ